VSGEVRCAGLLLSNKLLVLSVSVVGSCAKRYPVVETDAALVLVEEEGCSVKCCSLSGSSLVVVSDSVPSANFNAHLILGSFVFALIIFNIMKLGFIITIILILRW